MRKYETVLISDPDLSDQNRSDLYDKIRNIITNEKGILFDVDDWGNKKLAYEIRKKLRGHYACITYGGTGDLVNELERNFRLTDDVLKFMTIVLSEDMLPEDLEKEALENQKAKEENAPKTEPEADEQPVKETEEPASEQEEASEPEKEQAADSEAVDEEETAATQE